MPTQVLQDIRVLELGQLIAGPFAAKTLADFGAQVIKIEPPGQGDPLRKWRMLHEGTSVWWEAQSRNKQSVCVDLRVPEGQDVVRRLAAEADVLIENFRPGTMEKWGLSYEALSAINSVFCTVAPVTLTMMAVARVGAPVASQAGMIGPVSTLLLGWWLLGEPITLWQVGGSALVLAGMALLSRRGNQSN